MLRAQILSAVGGMLVKEEAPTIADAIVVLGGDAYGLRILKAAELAREGYAPVVWVSGGVSLLGNEAADHIKYANEHGFSGLNYHPVALTRDADSTVGEAALLGRELKAAGIGKIDLVTSNYHTRRSYYLWRKENPWLQITIVGAPDPYFKPDEWWKEREGQKTFLLEMMKTVASHLGK
jgi:uncharacterized SAM-binding protein YcdF (DUF218 family)